MEFNEEHTPPKVDPPKHIRPRATPSLVFLLITAGIILGGAISFAAFTYYFATVPTPFLVFDIKPLNDLNRVCPGESVTQILETTAFESAKIHVDSTYETEAGAPIIPGRLEDTAVVHVRPGQRSTKSAWVVPQLAAGTYSRTIGAHTPGRDSEQFLAVRYFTIPENCGAVDPNFDSGGLLPGPARPAPDQDGRERP